MTNKLTAKLENLEKWMRHGRLNNDEQHACSVALKAILADVRALEARVAELERQRDDAQADVDAAFERGVDAAKFEYMAAIRQAKREAYEHAQRMWKASEFGGRNFADDITAAIDALDAKESDNE